MSASQQVFLGARSLSALLGGVLKPAFRRRSSREAALMLDWAKIVKAEFAQRCSPEKLIFDRNQKEGGTLILAADSSSSLLIQHSEALLIQCINGYFGYPLVGKIKIKHSLLPSQGKAPLSSQQRPEMTPLDETLFPDLKDEELKTALRRLKAVYEVCALKRGS